jgi:hypothetical protein
MGDVAEAPRKLTDQNGREIDAARLMPTARYCRFSTDDNPDEEVMPSYRRVGRMGQFLQCTRCLVTLMPDRERQAWVGPDFDTDERDAHYVEYPKARVNVPAEDDLQDEPEPEVAVDAGDEPEGQDAGEQAPDTNAQRIALGLTTYPKRSDHQPSRTPDARHREYERAKRKPVRKTL